MTVAQILNPSALAASGLDATEPLADRLGDMGAFDMADMLVLGVGYIAIMACYIIMAINLFLAVLEYYLFAGIVGILLPFGLLPSTKFLAEKAIGAVVAAGIKLMVLAFITSAVLPVIRRLAVQRAGVRVQRAVGDAADRRGRDGPVVEGSGDGRGAHGGLA